MLPKRETLTGVTIGVERWMSFTHRALCTACVATHSLCVGAANSRVGDNVLAGRAQVARVLWPYGA